MKYSELVPGDIIHHTHYGLRIIISTEVIGKEIQMIKIKFIDSNGDLQHCYTDRISPWNNMNYDGWVIVT